MPVFILREIEDHKNESGKNGATIKKTSEWERYLNADKIQTIKAKDLFKFKGVFHASMKKEKRFVLTRCCP